MPCFTLRAAPQIEQTQDVARDHEIFIGWNHPRQYACIRHRDPRTMTCIRHIIERDAEPPCALAYPRTYQRRVLADAPREHERIQAAEDRGERSELPRNPIDEKLDCLMCRWRIAGKQRSHVTRDARYAEKTRSFVEQMLERRCVHYMLLQQVEHDARIQGTAAVPIGRPSNAVKPIVVPTLLPCSIAHMLAPLPRCAMTSRLLTHSGATSGSAETMYS